MFYDLLGKEVYLAVDLLPVGLADYFQVDRLGVRYKFVNFGAGKGLVSRQNRPRQD